MRRPNYANGTKSEIFEKSARLSIFFLVIIVIAGMQRSGSTWTFNVARELLQSQGSVDTISSDNILNYKQYFSNKHHLLIKSHSPSSEIDQLVKEGKALLICSIRKPEDAIASWMRVFGHDINYSIQQIEDWLSWHKGMKSYAFNMRYDEIDLHRFLSTKKLSVYLLPDASLTQIVRIWWKYSKRTVKKQTDELPQQSNRTTNIGFSYYDNENFFHRSHINKVVSERAEDVLTAESIKNIRVRLAEYISEDGSYVC